MQTFFRISERTFQWLFCALGSCGAVYVDIPVFAQVRRSGLRRLAGPAHNARAHLLQARWDFPFRLGHGLFLFPGLELWALISAALCSYCFMGWRAIPLM